MFRERMPEQNRGAGKGEQCQGMAEAPGQAVLDDVADIAAARRDAGHRGDMITVIAAPAIGQDAMQQPGAYAQAHPWANVYYYRYRPGFWPGDLAANIATVDAIATVPLRVADPTDNDYAAYYGDRPVSRLTTCGLQSGATYLGPDGRWYPC
jgi:hypothetical protein